MVRPHLVRTAPQLTPYHLRRYIERYGFPPVDEQAVLTEANAAYSAYSTWAAVPFALDAAWLDSLLLKHALSEETYSQTA